MKKERIKGFIAGVLACVLVGGMIGTAAATVGRRSVEIDYADIKIEMNDKKITPLDANGNIVEPFAINGTTYLPVRAVGNAMGLNVDWDGATSTVKLTGESDQRELYWHMVLAMDEYKSLEDQADRGKYLLDILQDEIKGSFSPYDDKNRISATLRQVADDDVASYENSLVKEEEWVNVLATICQTDYLKSSLDTAKDCCTQLRMGRGYLNLAYTYGIAYVNSATLEDWNMYMEYSQKAYDAFQGVIKNSQYLDIRGALNDMLHAS